MGSNGIISTLAGVIAALAMPLLCAQEGEPAAVVNGYSEPATQTAEVLPLTNRSLLLGFAETDQRAIVVGSRGAILVSESRSDWRQIDGVPTRSTLTAVTAVGSQAWAVGHDQVILHSSDGGLTWQRQHVAPFSEDNLDDPRNGAPFLDVLFLDADTGFAIGAYGLMLRTDDAGASWEPVPITAQSEEEAAEEEVAEADDSWTFSDEDLMLEEESNPHLNGIAVTGSGALFIAAERGSAYRSRDGGRTWERLQLPYDGSMFGVIGYDGDHILLYGLRGHVFESSDLGDHWEERPTDTELSLQGGAGLNGGGAVLVGSNGLLVWRKDADSDFQTEQLPDAGSLAAVLPVGGSGQLVCAGENGLINHVIR
ncbi:MAG: hypothetical protein KDI75_02685 [Xanthomonadales bacterium]|nr:hypothetical protein [Xanthomonadales bacterium]